MFENKNNSAHVIPIDGDKHLSTTNIFVLLVYFFEFDLIGL